MAKKEGKDFTAAAAVHEAIEEATQEPAEATKKEIKQTEPKQETRRLMATRMTLAFNPPDISDYVAIMSKVTGQSKNDFVCKVLEKDRERNMETYLNALSFIEAYGQDE